MSVLLAAIAGLIAGAYTVHLLSAHQRNWINFYVDPEGRGPNADPEYFGAKMGERYYLFTKEALLVAKNRGEQFEVRCRAEF